MSFVGNCLNKDASDEDSNPDNNLLPSSNDIEKPFLPGEEPTDPLIYGNAEDKNSFNEPSKKTLYEKLKARKYLVLCSSITFVILAVMLPVLFLVIIPDLIQQNVDETDITIEASDIKLPTNISFDSYVALSFSENPPIKSRVQMHDITVAWDGEGGGDMLVLKNSNSMNVHKSTHHLTSDGVVLDPVAFSNFCVYAMKHKSFKWHMTGKAKVHTFIEDVTVDIDKYVTIDGFNNFSISPVVQQVNVTGATKDYIVNIVQVLMYSEARVEMTFGQDLHFLVKSSRGIQIGVGTAADCSFYIGEFGLTTTVNMLYSNEVEYKELMRVFSNYIMGVDQPLIMQSFYLSTPVSWLDAALLTIDTTSTLPGMTDKLITKIDLYVDPRAAAAVPFTLILKNAFDTVMNITSIVSLIYYNNISIATVTEPNQAISIPPRTSITSPMLMSNTILAHLTTVQQLIAQGQGPLDVYNNITGIIGDGFVVMLTYNQLQTPSYVHIEG